MNGKVEQIKELVKLKESGALSECEFQKLKQELLASETEQDLKAQMPNNTIRNLTVVTLALLIIGVAYYFLIFDASNKKQVNKNTINENASVEFSFLGSWAGVGYQSSGSKWTIKVVLNEGDYRIDYPSLACGGPLTLISKSTNKMVFRESITRGVGKCTDGGKLIISRINDNELKWVWFDSNDEDEVNSRVFRYETQNEFDQIINLMDPSLGLKAGDCAQVNFVGKGLFNSGERNTVRGRLTYTGSSNAFMKIVSMSNGSLYYDGETRYIGNEIEVPKSWINTCD
ncbi:SHOCT domain-containing protein [Alteromonas stellipolaris]|uniref:SHOCT domain-containing protein n=1 Tax=Alteromonas stellipolaris TaxID=233316 RepID=UPI001D34B8E3|nr:SHOCT domain-containing protein [Alteromonas stellipolaris]MBZ2162121.1 SHOCT domain-containing protein [Alteromonas stellipolaris]